MTFTSFFRSALILGIQYLTFQAFPIIFEDGHHFDVQSTGLSFLGMGIGLFLGLACQPFINRYVIPIFFSRPAVQLTRPLPSFLRKQKAKYDQYKVYRRVSNF